MVVRRKGLGAMTVVKPAIEVEVPLRKKNQMTLPAPIAQALEAEPGDVLVFEVRPEDPGTARVRRLRDSYFGALAGTYGSREQILSDVRRERKAWDV